MHLLIISDSLLKLLGLHVTLGPSARHISLKYPVVSLKFSPQESLGVAGVELKGLVTISDAFRGALQLGCHRGAVEVQLGVRTPIVGIYGQGLTGGKT